jgi:glycosyltransferase involved in cell wall biosynthesis
MLVCADETFEIYGRSTIVYMVERRMKVLFSSGIGDRIARPVIWIAWERHRRTIEIAKFLGVHLVIFLSNVSRPLKYFKLALLSVRTIYHNCPNVVIVQNPSLVLTALVCIGKNILRYALIVDTHNAGLCYEEYSLPCLYKYVMKWLQRSADITIVTNTHLAERVLRNGGTAYVLPDRIPEWPSLRKIKLEGKSTIVCIANFGDDEPYRNIFECIELLQNDDIVIYITGNYRKALKSGSLPQSGNVIFTDYLDEEDYWNIIYSADLIMDLTTRPDCLVCGAYEAISVGTPMILSDTNTIRDYFNKGAIYTKHDPQSIAQSIMTGVQNIDRLRKEVVELKYDLKSTWESQVTGLISFLRACGGVP